ncbi:MAG: hypothetical protein DRP65_05330 [Planctomycetota bacterium]|nr:MAG: hypothetical protein DRP65_05330 [Planctomycetota bacterium]
MANLKTIFLIFLLTAVQGCGINSISIFNPSGPEADYYYVNPQKDLRRIGRVAVVELQNDSAYPHISADVTEMLFQELQKRQVFGLSVVRRNNPAWRSLQLPPDSPFNPDQLLSIRKVLGCNAVLIGTVTHYQPYPHMTIGLRLKIVDLTDGQLLWALEQIWDCADKTTESRIRRYLRYQKRSAEGSLREQLVSVSPTKFIKFVGYEVAATLYQ